MATHIMMRRNADLGPVSVWSGALRDTGGLEGGFVELLHIGDGILGRAVPNLLRRILFVLALYRALLF